jgi:glycosyltransferase involved in cell wall biosynthesis
MDRALFEPTLILLDGRPAASRELEPRDCEVIRLGVTKLLSRAGLRAARHVRQLWSRSRPDILQSYFLDASYFSVPLARWCGVPHVVRVRNNLGYWLTRKDRVLNRLIRPWVTRSLTNSEGGREQLIRQDGVSADRVTVIENGVDLDRFPDVRPPAFGETVRVGCVANLRPVKNIDGLMRAAQLVLELSAKVEFEVAGDGPDRPRLEQLRRELALGDRFRLRGSLADVPEFLRSLDLAVMPSHSEGMSNAVLEYMAAGRAIVATDTGATAQLVGPGVGGVIVAPGSDEALAGAIQKLIDDPPAGRRMAATARRRAEEVYGRQGMVRRFEAFYRSMI